jgi:hypothetical protein
LKKWECAIRSCKSKNDKKTNNGWENTEYRECLIYGYCQSGADPGFQVRGGTLKKNAPSGGRREHFGDISCEKSRFYPKKSYFFQLRREVRNFWGISCEKSRFYPKKSYFFQLRREVRNFWGISCEKSRFYAKNHIFSNFRGGARPLDPPLSISIYESSYMFSSIGIAIMNDSSYRQNMVGWLVYGA